MSTPRLNTFVTEVRSFLEPLWIKAHEGWADEPVPNPPSKYMCRYSCIFLKEALNTAGYGEWEIQLGRPATRELEGTTEGKFGYCTKEGKWYDHAWLYQNGVIMDITADQYDGEAVTITKENNSKYNPNLQEKDAQEDLQKLSKRALGWLHLWGNRGKT